MLLDRERILNAFGGLDEELGRIGTRADVFVVGGAAMAIAYDARRATADVDAIFLPAAEVRQAAQRVAARMGLPDFTTAKQGLDLVAAAYPARLIPPRTRFMLEEMFPERQNDGRLPERGREV